MKVPNADRKGALNPNWKGDRVKYQALHEWVRRNKPQPEFCESCNKNKSYEVANISQKYKRNINDYEWLCRSCHMKKDRRISKLHKISHVSLKLKGKWARWVNSCISCGKNDKPYKARGLCITCYESFRYYFFVKKELTI